MRHILLFALLFLGLNSTAQNWNRSMRLQTCDITVTASPLKATSLLTLEFYNPNPHDIEGLYRFSLQQHQVVTGFQLELNGKFRDGTIEEKWKATNAYNTIVGKRIDPALLTMESPGSYNLRIFPVPARSTRRVTITIEEIMAVENGNYLYNLPFYSGDSVSKLTFTGRIIDPLVVAEGIMNKKKIEFRPGQPSHYFFEEWHNIPAGNSLTFSWPLRSQSTGIFYQYEGIKYLAARAPQKLSSFINNGTDELTIYWDASLSGRNRDLNKELFFLQEYVRKYQPEKLYIIPFRKEVYPTRLFNPTKSNSWLEYLQSMDYDGTTRIPPFSAKAGTVMIFTDGLDVFRTKPSVSNQHVFAINSARAADSASFKHIVGTGGGSVINLNGQELHQAIKKTQILTSRIISISSSNPNLKFNPDWQQSHQEHLVFTAENASPEDRIFVHYGVGNTISQTLEVSMSSGGVDVFHHARYKMLSEFEKVVQDANWNRLLDHGLKEKIVTPYTAYIVLERLEDYVKYNIETPPDLKEECEKINYVKKDTRRTREGLQKKSQSQLLEQVITKYSHHLKTIRPEQLRMADEVLITPTLARDPSTGEWLLVPSGSLTVNDNILTGRAAGIYISEIVVKRSSLISVRSIATRNELMGYTSISGALQGRVPGLQVVTASPNINAAGSSSSIIIRGQSSSRSGIQPLFVLDGVPLSGNIDDALNINDIAHITILKDAAATALYGSRASGGVILIVSKRGARQGSQYPSYRLKNLPDVEYLQMIKNSSPENLLSVYKSLREIYGQEPAFFLDMAAHFQKIGLQDLAMETIYNAAEVSGANKAVLLATAYILESWSMWKDAAEIYELLHLREPNNISNLRDLGWMEYQQGHIEESANLLFKALLVESRDEYSGHVEERIQILAELNAIVFAHKDSLEFSQIPSHLLPGVPTGFRILSEVNTGDIPELELAEPIRFGSGRNDLAKVEPFLRAKGYGTHYDYLIANPQKGKYRVKVDLYRYIPEKTPYYLRLTYFENFGKPGQRLRFNYVVLNNQYGRVEVDDVFLRK